MISMFIPIEPVAQMRSRSRAFRDKTGRVRAMNYKAKKQEIAEDNLIGRLMAICREQNIKPFDQGTPLRLGVRVLKSIPASWSNKKRERASTQNIRPVGKPDLDNYIKHVKDCSKCILWHDDNQVVEYAPGTGKYYSVMPGWAITVEAI